MLAATTGDSVSVAPQSGEIAVGLDSIGFQTCDKQEDVVGLALPVHLGDGAATELSVDAARYCGVQVRLVPLPLLLADGQQGPASAYLRGTLATGQSIKIASERPLTLSALNVTDFSFDAAKRWWLVFQVGAWVAPVLPQAPKAPAPVEATVRAPALLSNAEDGVRMSLIVVPDLNDNGELDATELAWKQ